MTKFGGSSDHMDAAAGTSHLAAWSSTVTVSESLPKTHHGDYITESSPADYLYGDM